MAVEGHLFPGQLQSQRVLGKTDVCSLLQSTFLFPSCPPQTLQLACRLRAHSPWGQSHQWLLSASIALCTACVFVSCYTQMIPHFPAPSYFVSLHHYSSTEMWQLRGGNSLGTMRAQLAEAAPQTPY